MPLGSVVRKAGCGASLSGGSVQVTGGLYEVTATVTVAPSAAGSVTLSLLRDGQAVPGASATGTAAAGDSVPLSLACVVRAPKCPCSDAASLTLSLSAAGSVTSAAVTAVAL